MTEKERAYLTPLEWERFAGDDPDLAQMRALGARIQASLESDWAGWERFGGDAYLWILDGVNRDRAMIFPHWALNDPEDKDGWIATERTTGPAFQLRLCDGAIIEIWGKED